MSEKQRSSVKYRVAFCFNIIATVIALMLAVNCIVILPGMSELNEIDKDKAQPPGAELVFIMFAFGVWITAAFFILGALINALMGIILSISVVLAQASVSHFLKKFGWILFLINLMSFILIEISLILFIF